MLSITMITLSGLLLGAVLAAPAAAPAPAPSEVLANPFDPAIPRVSIASTARAPAADGLRDPFATDDTVADPRPSGSGTARADDDLRDPFAPHPEPAARPPEPAAPEAGPQMAPFAPPPRPASPRPAVAPSTADLIDPFAR